MSKSNKREKARLEKKRRKALRYAHLKSEERPTKYRLRQQARRNSHPVAGRGLESPPWHRPLTNRDAKGWAGVYAAELLARAA